MNLLQILGVKTEREKIVERLLAEKSITPKEAIVLLRSSNRLTINVKEMSSGAKVIFTDVETN